MWRVLLALISHRLLLLIVALISINSGIVHRDPLRKTFRIESADVLVRGIFGKVRETPEAVALEVLVKKPILQVFTETKQPFLWFARLLVGVTGIPISLAIILLSNVFLFFFLWELFALIGRMSTPDTTVSAVVLVLLWPTSYELSLGSALSLTCCLATLAVRHALDNEWFIGGIGLGLLALVDPIAAGLIPLLIYMFWYFQRGFPAREMLKKLALFLVPVAAAIAWRHSVYLNLKAWVEGSALAMLLKASAWRSVDWTFSKTLAGQTITAIFFITGAVAAAITNAVFIHRLIPLYTLGVVLAFSPYSAIASRASIAGICLQGIATISARPALRLIQLLLLTLSVLEVAAVFNP